MSNLRTMGQAMMLYANQYKGAIPGSALTSSRHFYSSAFVADPAITLTTVPAGGPIELWDYITPMGDAMKLKFVKSDDPNAAVRFQEQSGNKYFQCPSAAGLLATAFPTGSGPNIEPVSYSTAMGFMVTAGFPKPGVTNVHRISGGAGWPVLPSGYFPNTGKVRYGATKIFAADAAKFTYQGLSQEYELYPIPSSNAGNGGNHSKYTDWGAWSGASTSSQVITGAYDQTTYTTTAGAVDGRISSFRHGATSGHRDGSFKLNAVFFDGHAETLDDQTVTNPMYWFPSGTTFANGTGKVFPAAITKFNINATSYVVP